MERGRRAALARVGSVAAGVLLVGLAASGIATAETPPPVPVVGNALDSLTSQSGSGGSSSSDNSAPSSGSGAIIPDLQTSSMSSSSTSTSSTSTSSTSTSSTSTSSTSTSSTTSTSSGTYTITFPPTLPPGYGSDGGHRYFGRYWDASANCWRYASPNYVAPVVVATQVASVPKGGVNTGDGSFR